MGEAMRQDLHNQRPQSSWWDRWGCLTLIVLAFAVAYVWKAATPGNPLPATTAPTATYAATWKDVTEECATYPASCDNSAPYIDPACEPPPGEELNWEQPAWCRTGGAAPAQA